MSMWMSFRTTTFLSEAAPVTSYTKRDVLDFISGRFERTEKIFTDVSENYSVLGGSDFDVGFYVTKIVRG